MYLSKQERNWYNRKKTEELIMEISKNALENMLLAYIDHKKMLNEYNKEMSESDIEDDADYQFHKACCETSEMWMRAIGISPNCNFITESL